MTSNTELETPAGTTGHDEVPVLLVEDDDGDALLVEELLRDVDAPVVVQRARSLGQATTVVSDAACVLLDLGLPDSQGLRGLRQLLSIEPEAAIVVLTGDASEHLGEQAVRAGAQDYLVKGEVAGSMLHRVIRYAVERRRAMQAQRELRIAQVQARENARLERGLLPSPLLADPRLRVSARCLAGGQQHLLGGDFYDVVEVPDGWAHALMVDDDDADVLMTREAFEYYKIRNQLHVVSDGDQALQFLRRSGPFADAPRPGLILLDVNLPRRSGLEVLAELKRDPDLLVIPVVMLTTSRAEEDIVRSYSLHANAFVSKPVDFEHFIEAIRQIDNFFLTLVCLPTGHRS